MTIGEKFMTHEQLSPEEAVLHTKVVALLGNVLARHGVMLSGNELKFTAAEVADFIKGEITVRAQTESVANKPEAAEPEEQEPEQAQSA